MSSLGLRERQSMNVLRIVGPLSGQSVFTTISQAQALLSPLTAAYLDYESDSCKVFQNKPLNLVSLSPAH